MNIFSNRGIQGSHPSEGDSSRVSSARSGRDSSQPIWSFRRSSSPHSGRKSRKSRVSRTFKRFSLRSVAPRQKIARTWFDQNITKDIYTRLLSALKRQDVGEDDNIEVSEGTKISVAGICHMSPDRVLDFLLSNSDNGMLLRQNLHEYTNDSGERVNIVSWQHYVERRTKVVKYLLALKRMPPTKKCCVHEIEISSASQDDLPKSALECFKEANTLSNNQNIISRWVNFGGVAKISNLDFGQSALMIVGSLEAEGGTGIMRSKKKGISAEMAAMIEANSPKSNGLGLGTLRSLKSTLRVRSLHHPPGGSSPQSFHERQQVTSLFLSLKGILKEVQANLQQPDVIDERMKRRFIEKIPEAPPLTWWEQKMIAEKIGLVNLTSNAKRLGDKIKEDVEKFSFVKEGTSNMFGISYCTVDAPAEQIFADITIINTHEATRLHKEKNGDLPRKQWLNIDGSRSQRYSVAKKMSTMAMSSVAMEPRLFETWRCWKKSVRDNGTSQYVLAFTSEKDYHGKFAKKLEVKCKHTKADSAGVFIITEVAPKVCTVLRVQSVDLHIHLPMPLIKSQANASLNWANEIQNKHKRNGKKVDAEVRDAFVKGIKAGGYKLEGDQEDIFSDLNELFGGDDGWKALKSPYEGVGMKIKRSKRNAKGERTVGLGLGEATVDCTAEQAAAWLFFYNSNDRKITSKDLARLEIRKGPMRNNERTFVTVKKMPFLVSNRQFLFRQILKWDSDRSTSVATWPVNDVEVDYGGASVGKLTKATVKGLFTATNLKNGLDGVPQCKVIMKQLFDLGGYIPTKLLDKKMATSLKAVWGLQQSFKRDADVDKASLDVLTNIIKTKKQDYSDDEAKAMAKGKNFYKMCFSCEDSKFKELKNTDKRVMMKSVHLDGDSLVTGVCEAIIDAPVEKCVAYEFMKGTRERMALKKTKKYRKIEIKKISDHSQFYLSRRQFGYGLYDREWRNLVVWQKDDDGKVWIIYEDTDRLDKDFPQISGVTQASAMTTWCFEELKSKMGDITQCKATFTSKVDFGGAVPNSIMNLFTKRYMKAIVAIRLKFDRSLEIDAHQRQLLAEKMLTLGKKRLSVDLKEKLEEDVEDAQKTDDSCARAQTWLRIKSGGEAWGRSTFHVRAGLEDVAAYFWNVESRANQSLDDFEFKLEKRLDDFDMVVRTKERLFNKKIIKGFKREYMSRMKLFRTSKKTIIILIEPFSDHVSVEGAGRTKRRTSLRSSAGLRQSTEHTAIRLTLISERTTLVKLVTDLSLGEGISYKEAKQSVKNYIRKVRDASYYFIGLISNANATAEDGTTLGKKLMLNLKERRKGRSKDVEASDFILSHRILKESCEKYPFLRNMLCAVVKNKLKPLQNVEGRAECLGEKDGEKIGKSLAISLATTLTATQGTDEWILQFPALQEVNEEFVWFKTMMDQIGFKLMEEVSWGLKLRVAIGAGTSLADLGTDIYMLSIFWGDNNRRDFFHMSLTTLLVSVSLQLLIVILQNRSLGYRKVAKEAFPVFVGMKPALDAYRVVTGKEKEAGNVLGPMTEMTINKMIELFAEAIPNTIIQLAAMTTSTGIETGAWVSLIISALTTGFISATISYDWDTDPEKRKSSPDFYGYVPAKASKRLIMMITLTGFSAGMLLIRCLTIVLLGHFGAKYVFIFITIDMFIFLLIKILRGDFWYWIPFGGDTIQAIMSMLFRVIVKLVTDFTSLVHMRHPNEVGGANWLLGLILSMGMLPVAFQLYKADQRGKGAESNEEALFVGKLLMALTTLIFLIFFFNTEKRFRRTFYSSETGKGLAVRNFRQAKEEAEKARIFENTHHYYDSIEDELKQWISGNWYMWVKSKPVWFDEAMRESIPMKLIPSDYTKKKERSARRRTASKKRRKRSTLAKVAPLIDQVVSATETGKGQRDDDSSYSSISCDKKDKRSFLRMQAEIVDDIDDIGNSSETSEHPIAGEPLSPVKDLSRSDDIRSDDTVRHMEDDDS